MKFRAGDLEFNANVAESSEAPSPQTGDPLHALTIQFRAQKIEMHERALQAAAERQHGGLFSIGETDQPDLEWRVCDSSTQYVGTEPWGINHHIWRIEQVERLACERLVIGPLSLEPYEYAEVVDDQGGVRLAARASVADAQLEALATLGNPVEVRRVGISDTPRQMRLEYVWGPRADGFGVVVRAEDAREPRVTLQGVSEASDPLQDLVAVLHARGVLAAQDVTELQRRRHAARQVTNVDTWSLTD